MKENPPRRFVCQSKEVLAKCCLVFFVVSGKGQQLKVSFVFPMHRWGTCRDFSRAVFYLFPVWQTSSSSFSRFLTFDRCTITLGTTSHKKNRFLSGIAQITSPGRLKLKWSKSGSNGARVAQMEQDVWAPWKNAPWTPLKVTEVNQFFLGGLKHVNNSYFSKNGFTLVYFGLGSAVSNLQTPMGVTTLCYISKWQRNIAQRCANKHVL